eukprot:11709624-Alexandrium_andersonii.AAC.1
MSPLTLRLLLLLLRALLRARLLSSCALKRAARQAHRRRWGGNRCHGCSSPPSFRLGSCCRG